MSTRKTRMADALEPVRQRLLRQAQDDAAAIRAAARAEADQIVAEARAGAVAAVRAAAAEGRADGARQAGEELRRARDLARSAVLSAQRAACDELRTRVRDAVRGLPGEPGYDGLAARLSELAGRAAGPAAVLTPAQPGGVVARSAGVIVDCSLDRLAELAVAALGPAIRELWEP